MAIGLALLMMASPAQAPPETFDLATVGKAGDAAGMIDRERDVAGFKPKPCHAATETEIVVCARRGPSTSPRLPMPAARFEEGDVVHYANEVGTPDPYPEGRNCARPGSCEPSKLGETLGKIFNWLGGNDP